MQTNHFSKPGISLKASVANIPWLGRSFVGFIAGLYFENQLIEFTTYKPSSLVRLQADADVKFIDIKNGKILFSDRSEHMALEVAGNLLEILTQ